MKATKKCIHCGRDFETYDGAAKYCSKACRADACYHPVTVKCPVCGKESKRSPSDADRVYCSRECYNKQKAERVVKKICPRCGKEFEVFACYKDRVTYCSQKCHFPNLKYVNCERCGKPFALGHNNRKHYCSEECRRPPVIEKCATCGKEFRRVPAAIHHQFCSRACYRRYRGENHLERRFRIALESLGLTFIQEAPIGKYTVDFALVDRHIAIEVDGEYWHDPVKDQRRDRFLERNGWTVIRFGDSELEAVSNLPGFIMARLESVVGEGLPRRQPTLTEYV